MFRRRPEKAPGAARIDTYIGKGTTVEGSIEASGSVRIDGFVKGTLRVDGDLIIGGADGVVVASVTAANVTVAGELRGGEVNSPGRLDIAPTGQMLGDVIVGSLNVDDGALFLGQCNMKDEVRSQPKVLAAPDDSGNSDSQQ